MESTQGIKTWQWVVTGIVIIVFIVIGVLVFSNKSTESPSLAENPAVPEAPVAGKNQIIINDQFPGNIVYTSSVQLSSPGFVVIQKDAAGKPGTIIGSTYLPSGTSPAKINLSQPMLDGSLYYASLYSDTDNNQKFDINIDKPVTNISGSAIMAPFRATSSAGNEVKG